MVAPGAGFRGDTLYRPNNWQRPKKRSSLQNELVFSRKVCDDQKTNKKGLCLPISGFSVSKEKKTQMVSPQNGDTGGGPPPPPPPPPPLATPLLNRS